MRTYRYSCHATLIVCLPKIPLKKVKRVRKNETLPFSLREKSNRPFMPPRKHVRYLYYQKGLLCYRRLKPSRYLQLVQSIMKNSILPMSSHNHTDLTISDLFKGDLQLTSPPAIYFQLKKVIDDPHKSLSEAGKIIDKDPALSMRLLKVVNSAFFGFPSQISTISHAISLIGIQELQNLVLGTLIIEKFSVLPGGMLSMHDFWALSLRSALTAKELANYWKHTEENESLFICGLLHDIGKLVFYRRIPDLAREVGLLVETVSLALTITRPERSYRSFGIYRLSSQKLWLNIVSWTTQGPIKTQPTLSERPI